MEGSKRKAREGKGRNMKGRKERKRKNEEQLTIAVRSQESLQDNCSGFKCYFFLPLTQGCTAVEQTLKGDLGCPQCGLSTAWRT